MMTFIKHATTRPRRLGFDLRWSVGMVLIAAGAISSAMADEGKSVVAASPYVPAWAYQAIFYQIFPERFENGDRSNDPTRASLESPGLVPDTWAPTRWTSDWYQREAWEVAMGDSFFRDGVSQRRYGGDLQGILNRLDYLKKLGVNTLYLNPIFYARSHHKYDGNTYHHVDPYFGPDPTGDLALIAGETLDSATWNLTAADKLFFKLVAEVHRRGMRILLDGVFNHTGRDFPAFVSLRELQAQSPYKDWYMVESFDDPNTADDEFRYHGWWSHQALPEFANNTKGDDLHPGPKAYVFAATKRWMDPNGDGDPRDGIDGWRLDVAHDMPLKFWSDWNLYVRTINPSCYTVAELWDETSDFLAEGKFSATMNYHGFALPVKGFFVDGKLDASKFIDQLAARRDQHSSARRYALQNLIDSHDTPRVSTMIVNASERDYDQPEQFDYDPGNGRSQGYKIRKPTLDERRIQRMVALFQMVYVGTPLLYYGTEAGMWGGDDPCDRMPMVWPDKVYSPQVGDPWGRPREADVVKFDRRLHRFYRAACHLRQHLPALQLGQIETIATDDSSHAFVIRRWDDQHSVYAIFNRGDAPYQWKFDNSGGRPLAEIFTASGQSYRIVVATDGPWVTVTVPAREGVVLLQRRK